jgi:hypothetical protein
MSTTDTASADLLSLLCAYASTSSLREIVAKIRDAGVEHPASIATWSRIIRGEQEPTHAELCQIAAMFGVAPPEPPLDVQAEGVEEWYKPCNGPAKRGVLLPGGGDVRYIASADTAAPLACVVRRRTSTRRRAARATVHLFYEDWKALLEEKNRLGLTWPEYLHGLVEAMTE